MSGFKDMPAPASSVMTCAAPVPAGHACDRRATLAPISSLSSHLTASGECCRRLAADAGRSGIATRTHSQHTHTDPGHARTGDGMRTGMGRSHDSLGRALRWEDGVCREAVFNTCSTTGDGVDIVMSWASEPS